MVHDGFVAHESWLRCVIDGPMAHGPTQGPSFINMFLIDTSDTYVSVAGLIQAPELGNESMSFW